MLNCACDLLDYLCQRQPHGFTEGMKLEVVDRRNPILVRVASIVDIEPHRILLHFDGWLDVYDYWEDDDSPDIHPPGWCSRTGYPLTPPICKHCLASPAFTSSILLIALHLLHKCPYLRKP